MSDLNRQSGNKLKGWGRSEGRSAATPAAQRGIWFAQQINPSSSEYNIGEYIEIRGSIDPLLFERALRQVVAEAQTLRVQITVSAGEPKQLIGPPPAWSMPTIDVSAEADPRAAAEAWMRADLARPIEPTRAPLFGYALFKAAADQFFWYARYHHIVMDGFGMWLMARRLAEVYTQLSSGQGAQDGAFGSLAVLLDEDAAYRASEQFACDRQYWSRAFGRSARAGQPRRSYRGANPTAASCATRSISNGRLFVSSAPSRTAWGPASLRS